VYGLTRAGLTLIGVLAAGVILWLSTQIVPLDDEATRGEYWAIFGVVAAAGLTMALSQLLGGWTKWGWPRVSGNVFLLGFLPALVLGGWIIAAGEPRDYWLGDHVRSWSDDLGLEGLVNDLTFMIPAIAFGIGLVFGFTFDTTGPRVVREREVEETAPVPPVAAAEQKATTEESTDERRVHIHNGEEGTAEREAVTPRGEQAPKD
jgi:MFS family permease